MYECSVGIADRRYVRNRRYRSRDGDVPLTTEALWGQHLWAGCPHPAKHSVYSSDLFTLSGIPVRRPGSGVDERAAHRSPRGKDCGGRAPRGGGAAHRSVHRPRVPQAAASEPGRCGKEDRPRPHAGRGRDAQRHPGSPVGVGHPPDAGEQEAPCPAPKEGRRRGLGRARRRSHEGRLRPLGGVRAGEGQTVHDLHDCGCYPP